MFVSSVCGIGNPDSSVLRPEEGATISRSVEPRRISALRGCSSPRARSGAIRRVRVSPRTNSLPLESAGASPRKMGSFDSTALSETSEEPPVVRERLIGIVLSPIQRASKSTSEMDVFSTTSSNRRKR